MVRHLDKQRFKQQLAVEQVGDASSQFAVGCRYEKGLGVAKDQVKAVEWYTKAAVQGHAWAQYLLGRCYESGHGVTQDETKAFKWYEKAAVQGHGWAQGRLGRCYEYGRGVAQDDAEAFKWYEKAAVQGNEIGQGGLGWCYERGRGVAKDETKAVEWYEKAAVQGDAQIQCRLGLCYEFGRGVAQDEAKAVEWYEKADAQRYWGGAIHLNRFWRENIWRKRNQILSMSSAAEIKQETIDDESTPKQQQNKDTLLLDLDELFPVTPTDRETKESKQTKIQAAEVSQLTADIQQGDTAALRKVLATPVAQQSEPLQHYLQSQAIWTVLGSDAKPAHKSAQIALLAEAPNISLLVENEQRQLPLDVALQQLAKGRIDKAAVQKLQDATYEQRAAADEEILQAIEIYAQTAPTDILEEKASARPGETKSTANSEDGPITPQQLAAEVQKLSAADEALQQQFKTVSLPALQSSASSSSQPKQLSKQQRNLQKKLFQQMVHQLVSKKFIQSVGIGQGWVEAVSTKKATVAKAGVTFAVGTALNVAVPGVGGLIASGGKALAEKGYSERQKALSRKHTLGLISLKQLAMVTSYIEHYLLHRYQDFLLQRNLLLSKKAMETFIHCLIERMCLYVEKIDKPEDIIPLLSDKLVNLSKRKKTSHAITPSVPFTDAAAAQVAENLVAGTSLLNLGLVDSLVDKVGSGTDALITCLTADGSEKELRVNDICHSPAVTLTAAAEKASLQVNTTPDDLEYEGRYAPGSQWTVGECGVRCISREEADIENLSMITPWQDGLPISRTQSDIAKLQAKVQELEQQVAAEQAKIAVAETGVATEKARADAAEATANGEKTRADMAEARANTEKARADAAETRVGELEQQVEILELSHRALGQQLGEPMEKTKAGKPASSAHHQSNGGPGMFAGNPSLGKPTKLPARTPPPVAGQPQSTLPFPSPGAIERVGL